METTNSEMHVATDQARAGSTPKVVRYVLIASLALAIMALSALWIGKSVGTPDDTSGAAATRQAVSEGKASPIPAN